MAVPLVCGSAVFLLLLLVSQGNSNCADDAALVAGTMLDDNQCTAGALVNHDEDSVYDPSKGIKMEIEDEDAGVLKVTFPLASYKKYNTYRIHLYVADPKVPLSQEECSAINFLDSNSKSFKEHSDRYFDVYQCQELGLSESNCTSSCSQEGFVRFRYIFSGCYSVRFEPELIEGSQTKAGHPFTSNNTLLTTNFQMKRLIEKPPVIANFVNGKEHNVRVTVTYPAFERVPVWLTLFSNVREDNGYTTCLKSGIEQSCCVHDGRNETSSCNAKPNAVAPICNTRNETWSCNAKPNAVAPICNTNMGRPGLSCIFNNVSQGNYCLTMEVLDPVRCPGSDGSVWMLPNLMKCLFYFNFSVTYPEISPHEPVYVSQDSTNSTIVIVGVVIALLVSVGVVWVSLHYVKNKSGTKRPPFLLPISRSVSDVQPEILLLYAQDCQPFMKLMTTFRDLLRNVGNCEVLDCFDPAKAEEVAISPVEWMRYRANNRQVKVVVVASESAVAHQRALGVGIRLQYHQPLPYNMLFLQGLKTLTYETADKEYLQNFVVRFDDTDLSYLSPYTRFNLPQHLLKLLQDLNPNLNITSLQDFKDVQKLRDDHTDFLLFKRQNSHYLSTMMTRSAEVV